MGLASRPQGAGLQASGVRPPGLRGLATGPQGLRGLATGPQGLRGLATGPPGLALGPHGPQGAGLRAGEWRQGELASGSLGAAVPTIPPLVALQHLIITHNASGNLRYRDDSEAVVVAGG
ncbi:unnamed protein product [Boreogadus saida]